MIEGKFLDYGVLGSLGTNHVTAPRKDRRVLGRLLP